MRRYQTETGGVGSVPAAVLRTENGKPYFESGFPQLGVTHSDSVVIIALADTPFGIDCEDTDRRVPHRDALCKRFFSESEKEFVKNAGSEEEKTRRFLEIWVKKELMSNIPVRDCKACPPPTPLRFPGALKTARMKSLFSISSTHSAIRKEESQWQKKYRYSAKVFMTT